jgi:pseudaminic acid biosynthesis-associated methylase
MKNTQQMQEWQGDFGQGYLNRNSNIDIDDTYKANYGITRTEMNLEFLEGIDKNLRILEVGCNVGLQLRLLQEMGFKNLYGIELNEDAIEVSKRTLSHVNIIKGDAFDIPFKSDYFDLVFTSVVLIHISPDDIADAMNEIYRVTKRYIWGFEYYADHYTKIEYRGKENLLWKTNFLQLYLNNYPQLNVLKRNRYTYLNDPALQDEMFLLSK